MTKISSGWIFSAVCGGLFLAGITLLSTAARGDEPACPKCSAAQKEIPVLSRIPYINRLFKTSAAKCEDCQSEQFERVGVDFDFDVQVCENCPPPASASKTSRPIVARWFVVEGENQPRLCLETRSVSKADFQRFQTEPKVLACEPPTCAAPTCKAGNCVAGTIAACCAAPCCDEACERSANVLSQESVIEIYAENAALKATLEAQSAFHKEKMEMIEMLAGLTAEKAKLESHLEALVQQNQATKETLALMSENARLKAQVEAAETKLNIVHEMAKLAMENEQLKLALQKRQNHGLISNDAEYLPPAPEAIKSRPAKLER